MFVIRWHASILREVISKPTSLKTSKTLYSKSSLQNSRETPKTSNHSLLEYYTYSQHCFSISTTLWLRCVLTCYINFRFKLKFQTFQIHCLWAFQVMKKSYSERWCEHLPPKLPREGKWWASSSLKLKKQWKY